jgi:hypothetical protein
MSFSLHTVFSESVKDQQAEDFTLRVIVLNGIAFKVERYCCKSSREKTMKKIFEENIELLKEKLDLNKQILEENRQNLRNVIQQPHSNERTELFFRHYQISLELSSRNCHFIKMQNELSRSMNNNGFKSFGQMSLS